MKLVVALYPLVFGQLRRGWSVRISTVVHKSVLQLRSHSGIDIDKAAQQDTKRPLSVVKGRAAVHETHIIENRSPPL